jgi:hypothetical protein
MNESAINQSIDNAFNAAISNGGIKQQEAEVYPNVFLRTDSYVHPNGSGFRVVCTIKRNDGAFIYRVKNYGPDIEGEKPWPQEGIEIALQNATPPSILLKV